MFETICRVSRGSFWRTLQRLLLFAGAHDGAVSAWILAVPSIDYLKTSGGIFKDMMIHDFDLARYYIGKDEFESIFATGSNLHDKKFNKIKDFELASCVLKTKKGMSPSKRFVKNIRNGWYVQTQKSECG